MFYDNLLVACEKKGVKVTPLVIECGGASGSISNWKKGASPNSDIVLKLATRLNVSTDYLLTGKEKFLNDNLDTDQQKLIDDYKTLSDIDKARVLERVKTLKELDDTSRAEAARRRKAELEVAASEKTKPKPKVLPVQAPIHEPEPIEDIKDEEENEGYMYLDFPDLPVSAGTGVYLHDDYAEQIKVPVNEETIRANYALKVAGDSMEPRFYDGDIVLVETQPSVEIGEVGIFIYEGEAYIKEFGGDRLISINPKYDDIKITDSNSFYCKGRVFSVLDPVKNKYN